MKQKSRHLERHYQDRVAWLRAAVLGANDGIVSTASLIVGVAAAEADRDTVLLAGASGLVAGAMSMAAGEYVSVSSQADSEKADLAREKRELETDRDYEHDELARIYQERGLDRQLAEQVAEQMMAHDALAAHARDELGIDELKRARPVQAALASALTFAAGAALPLSLVSFAPMAGLVWLVAASSLLFLALLGVSSARVGGSNLRQGALRVTLWGAVAMCLTALVGRMFGPAL